MATTHALPHCTQRQPRLIRSEEHTSELQSRPHLVCRLLLEKKNPHVYRHLIAIAAATHKPYGCELRCAELAALRPRRRAAAARTADCVDELRDNRLPSTQAL